MPETCCSGVRARRQDRRRRAEPREQILPMPRPDARDEREPHGVDQLGSLMGFHHACRASKSRGGGTISAHGSTARPTPKVAAAVLHDATATAKATRKLYAAVTSSQTSGMRVPGLRLSALFWICSSDDRTCRGDLALRARSRALASQNPYPIWNLSDA